MHFESFLPTVVGVALVVLAVGMVLRLLRQPHVVAYLLAGVVVGPFGLGLVTEGETLTQLGEVGVVLLLFFIGLEVSPPKLVASWRVALWGSLLQIGASVGLVAVLGGVLGRPLGESILLGFVISLSSTAVVAKLLHDGGELGSRAGRHVLAILLAQDLALIPMLVGVQLLAGDEVPLSQLALQVGGSAAFLAALAWALTRRNLRLPLGRLLRRDAELQVFAALILCFGLALVSALIGLSAALGAFLAGVILSSARETGWVRDRLESFHVVFLGLFFVSIGMLIDLRFLVANLPQVALLVGGILVINTVINAGILRFLGDSRRSSLYAGALLAQVGELSFLLVTAGYGGGLIDAAGYQTALATIALSLLLSPAWIGAFRRLTRAGEEDEDAPAVGGLAVALATAGGVPSQEEPARAAGAQQGDGRQLHRGGSAALGFVLAARRPSPRRAPLGPGCLRALADALVGETQHGGRLRQVALEQVAGEPSGLAQRARRRAAGPRRQVARSIRPAAPSSGAARAPPPRGTGPPRPSSRAPRARVRQGRPLASPAGTDLAASSRHTGHTPIGGDLPCPSSTCAST